MSRFNKFGYKIITPFISILIALLIGAFILLLIGNNPIIVYATMLNSAFGSFNGLVATLQRATPYIFGGLAFAIASYAGLFNIGIEGQMYVGSLFAAIVGFSFSNLPAIVHLPLSLIAGVLGGMLWAIIPAVLKVTNGVSEVITTVMLNYIAYAFTAYITIYIFPEPGAVAQTLKINPNAMLPSLLPPQKLNWGFILAIMIVIIFAIFLYKTPKGYELRITGLNPIASRFSGVNNKTVLVIAMIISGILAGLMGAERSLGVYGRFMQSFSPGYGFTAIAVAVLGQNHPIGIIFSAILFGALENGADSMALFVDVPKEIGMILQALIIVVVSSFQFAGSNWFRRKAEVTEHE